MTPLRKYNEKTKRWETITATEVTVIHEGDTGPVTDDDVKVNNPVYTDESGNPTTLSETLSVINDDISRLNRNVSWLAEHGGGGGWGPGVTPDNVQYGIEFIQSGYSIIDDTVTIQNLGVTLLFRVTGGTKDTNITYSASLDNRTIKSSTTATCLSDIYLRIPNVEAVNPNISTHTVTINVLDYLGDYATSKSIRIMLSSIKMSVVLPSYGGNKIPLVIDGVGDCRFKVTNKISDTKKVEIVFNSSDAIERSVDITSQLNGPAEQDVIVSLFNNGIIDKTTPYFQQANASYPITAYLKVTDNKDGVTTTKDNETKFTTVITGGDNISILVNGISLDGENTEVSKFYIGDYLTFSFTPIYKTPNALIYYCVAVVNEGTGMPSMILNGSYFDDTIKSDGAVDFMDNPHVRQNELVRISSYIDNDSTYIKDGYKLVIRCWYNNIVNEVTAVFDLEKSNSMLFENQYPKVAGSTTLFLNWDNYASTFPKNSDSEKWPSIVNGYRYNGVSTSINANMNIYRTNGSTNGFIVQTGGEASFLRMQNASYSHTDISEYKTELERWLNTDQGGSGYTVSVVFKSDLHPVRDYTVFYMGETNSEGYFVSGMKIDLNNVTFTINGKSISAAIEQNTMTSVDFVYSTTNKEMRIYVNGILNGYMSNVVYNSTISESIPTEIYVGCRKNGNGILEGFSDTNIYSVKVIGAPLNDQEIVINSFNARLLSHNGGFVLNKETNHTIADEIEGWKKRNLFDLSSDVPNSSIFLNGSFYESDGIYDDLIKLEGLSLPVVYVTCPQGNGFTEDFVYKAYSDGESSVTAQTFNGCSMRYYDPKNKKQVFFNGNIGISLQGTSTTTYRSKNFEIKILSTNDDNHPELFQPKETWMPEYEFTLKADVVDSAHANNATIGRFINEIGEGVTGFLEKNPAQLAVDENPPLDVYNERNEDGDIINTVTATTKNEDNEDVSILHTECKVKHTLEGFPVILLIQFDKTSKPSFQGIYSFNLGRYSDYNMGFKFLKSFSRRLQDNGFKDESCPAKIIDYVEYGESEPITYNDGLNKIYRSQIFSFEFNGNPNTWSNDYPLFSQDDISFIKDSGEFKFPKDEPSDFVFRKPLGSLFKVFTGIGDLKFKYRLDGLDAVAILDGNDKHEQYTSDPYGNANLNKRFSICNGNAYFLIANALGMVDSLGKNFTIRTWNAVTTQTEWDKKFQQGDTDIDVKWYPCFYDMDSSLGLDNAGNQNVADDVYIDRYYNVDVDKVITAPKRYSYKDESGNTIYVDTIDEIPKKENGDPIEYTDNAEMGRINYMEIEPNSLQSTNGFTCYNSKMWDVLRSVDLKKGDDTYQGLDLYQSWEVFRNNILKSEKTFIDLMEDNIGNNGELLYNYDYYMKYVATSTIDGVVSTGDASKLFGNRINYVREWMRRHLIFLDSIFIKKFEERKHGTSTISTPYMKIVNLYYDSKGNTREMTIKTNAPVIFKVTIGSSKNVDYYVKSYTETKLVFPSSQASIVCAINATDIITKLDGLAGATNFIFMKSDSTLPSMSEITISGATNCGGGQYGPFNWAKSFVSGGTSNIRLINLSGSKVVSHDATQPNRYPVTLKQANDYEYSKLTSIDISNSNVESLELPDAPLQYLNVKNSSITTFTSKNQPFLTDLSFVGCKNINFVDIDNWKAIEVLDISSLQSIKTVKVQNCANLKKIILSKNTSLSTVELKNLPKLEVVNFNGCSNENLSIDLSQINTMSQESSLKSLELEYTKAKIIKLPSRISVKNLESLQMSGSSLEYFVYGNDAPLEYDGEKVFDVSPMENLNVTNENCVLPSGIKYIKVANIKDKPFKVSKTTFANSNDLTRIFGHFELMVGNALSGKRNFTLGIPENRYPKDVKKDAWFNGEMDTNMTFDPSINNLNDAFNGTNITIWDVYYILQRCGNIKSLEGAFSHCSNIHTYGSDTEDGGHALHRDMFSECLNVTSIDDLFAYSRNVGGFLTGPLIQIGDYLYGDGEGSYGIPRDDYFTGENYTMSDVKVIKNGLITPMSGIFNNNKCELTTFNNVFFNAGSVWIGSGFFLADIGGYKIKSINNFNPWYGKDDAENKTNIQGIDSEFMRSLPHIETINNSFNNGRGIICGNMNDAYSSCDLLYYNTKLKSITNSFHFTWGDGNVYTFMNLFGGRTVNASNPSGDTKHFPQELEEVSGSFGIEYESGSPVKCYIDDSLLQKCKFTIKKFANNFNGNGLRNIVCRFVSGNNELMPNGSNEVEGFPYAIFSGCTALTDASGLFRNAGYVDELSNDIVYSLPYDPNKDTVYHYLFNPEWVKNLVVANEMFANLKVKHRLVGNGFKDTNITSMAGIFTSLGSECNRIGFIPYHMFYQSMETTMTESAVTGYRTAESAEEETYVRRYLKPRQRITDLSRCFAGSASLDLSGYKCDGKQLDYINGNIINDGYTDIVVKNDDEYNPFEYIKGKDGNKVPNPDYNPHKFRWNINACDGTLELTDSIKKTNLYNMLENKDQSIMDENGMPILPCEGERCFPPEFITTGQTGEIKRERELFDEDIIPNAAEYRNYICSPDLFNYCVNNQILNINEAFYNSSKAGNDDVAFRAVSGVTKAYMCALIGTIPPHLFDKVSEIATLNGVFEGCYGIQAYKWSIEKTFVRDENYNTYQYGILYPPTLFKKLTNLSAIERLFAGTTMWYACKVPDDIFENNKKLRVASGLWRFCRWYNAWYSKIGDEEVYGDYEFISTKVFKDKPSLLSVDNMFAGYGGQLSGKEAWNRSHIPYVESGIIPDTVQSIAGFMSGCKMTTGSGPIPTDVTNYKNAYAGCLNLNNLESIPEDWKHTS